MVRLMIWPVGQAPGAMVHEGGQAVRTNPARARQCFLESVLGPPVMRELVVLKRRSAKHACALRRLQQCAGGLLEECEGQAVKVWVPVMRRYKAVSRQEKPALLLTRKFLTRGTWAMRTLTPANAFADTKPTLCVPLHLPLAFSTTRPGPCILVNLFQACAVLKPEYRALFHLPQAFAGLRAPYSSY